ncbi:MAG TPA: choice-of-anchor Q domain-containing protein [Rhodanobacteraceae bacterium]|nr:choice-of-anchor Q domain-containing protein [Rhodanobacteraceae bacterium]
MTAKQPGLPRCRALAAALAFALSSSAAPTPRGERLAPMAATPVRPSHVDGSIPFTNCNDSGPGSLREAVAAASDNGVVFASNLACSTITLTTGEILVTVDSLQIYGPGPDLLTIANGAQSRVFHHRGARFFRLYGMTISDGYTTDFDPVTRDVRGGCILSNGLLTLGSRLGSNAYAVTVRNCAAYASEAGESAKGGGIFAAIGLTLNKSKVLDNRAIARAPGIYARGGGVYGGGVSMHYSEVSGNRAYGGITISRAGGVDAVGGSTIYSSTIANNEADLWGGALLGRWTDDFLAIVDSTISGNHSSGDGGGVYVYNYHLANFPAHVIASTITLNRSDDAAATAGLVIHGPVEMQSSIVSGNTSAGNPGDLRSVTESAFGSSNLVGAFTGYAPPPDELILSNDPRLAPLANNGGVTRTHALLPDSPAIDAGTLNFDFNLDLDYDQRGDGYPRTVGPSVDIGAFEFDPDVVFRNGFD